ncbi:hypothetical protein K5X82_14190 [Halosquirtibacter xylanolyticus]|uniref:hypothetical protein n=1 Tax=Halosquirtibacter xylanolyticus TaxID=3374599 RepID=UPI0037487562|nr:hypothetical protein K5X82_14190 [Prolixibacteraceae bacterium]
MKKALLMLMVLLGVQLSSFSMEKPDVTKLPKYVIITIENTKLLGGIGMTIDWKRSPYKPQLQELLDYLELKDGRRIRAAIDLFNVMDELGFEYKDAYNANSGSLGVGNGNSDIEVSASQAKFRVNIVFKKYNK